MASAVEPARLGAGLQTTVIGSFPKPDYLKVADWFKSGADGAADATRTYSAMLRDADDKATEELESDFLRATKDVIEDQACCGIDVVTDGEVRRDNYIHYLCRFIEGIDFDNLTRTSFRNGAFVIDAPTVRGKVSWRGGLDVVAEWRKAQDLAGARPVKYTLPGPSTIIGTVHDAHYGDEEALAADLATILNVHIRALAQAGCKHVQVDEPCFVRQSKKALSWGIKMLERCFDGVDGERCERAMHMCCGYPRHLDDADYAKADPGAYLELAPALDAASCIDVVSIEDAHRHNDLALLKCFSRTKVIFGCIQIASSRVESVEEIESRLREALKHIEPQRLVVAPDCGLAFLPRDVLLQKLSNMCKAASRCCDGKGCKRKLASED